MHYDYDLWQAFMDPWSRCFIAFISSILQFMYIGHVFWMYHVSCPMGIVACFSIFNVQIDDF